MTKAIAGVALGLACAVAALALGRLPFVRTIELKTYDWRMRATAEPSRARDDIVLVTIDEASLRKLEPLVGRWPWPRLVHAELVDFLARAPAKVVAYDVLFTEHDRKSFQIEGDTWTGEESDNALAAATRRAGNVVHIADAAAEATEGGAPAGEEAVAAPSLPGPRWRLDASIEERPVLTPPIPGLLAASRAVGHNFGLLDPDGPLRRIVPFVRVRGTYLASLGVATAAVALGLTPEQVRVDGDALWLGDRRVPLIAAPIPSFYGERRTSRRALLPYRGGAFADGRTTYREYSFYDLFYAQQQLHAGVRPSLDPAAFKDKIVIVGTTVPALFDLFTVPFPGKMSGAQVHASVIDAVLSNRSLEPAQAWVGIAVTLATAVALGLAGVYLGPWIAIAIAAAAAAAIAAGAAATFGRGLWVPLVEPLAAVALATFSGVTYQWVVEGREKRRVKRLFSRYVSKDVYEQLLADPTRARLGGQRRAMSVLFSDIRGFTSVTEKGQPEAIVAQLNEYFSRMVEVLFAHRGTLDKFVGDMVMALFGAPLDDEEHADHAVQTAIAMVRALEELNVRWVAEGRPPLGIGIGVNTGEMVAGNIGAESIMSYTVIGDNVNLGARLESLNKDYGSRIIISDATRQALRGRYDMRPLGSVTVKGKTHPVDIYEVVVHTPVDVAHEQPGAGA